VLHDGPGPGTPALIDTAHGSILTTGSPNAIHILQTREIGG
jgi:hypothetical protein